MWRWKEVENRHHIELVGYIMADPNIESLKAVDERR